MVISHFIHQGTDDEPVSSETEASRISAEIHPCTRGHQNAENDGGGPPMSMQMGLRCPAQQTSFSAHTSTTPPHRILVGR